MSHFTVGTIENIKFAYVGGTSPAFDKFKISWGKNSEGKLVSIVNPLYLSKIADCMGLFLNGEQVAATSAVRSEEWITNFVIENVEYPLIRVINTKNSKYYFVPITFLS